MSVYDIINKKYVEDEDIIKLILLSYEKRKKEKRLYSKDDELPQTLIKEYFMLDGRSDFSRILYNFKRKYIYNENEIENIHTKEERDGLNEVYNYIKEHEKDVCPNIYVILILHKLLYSKVPFPEFGGKFRNSVACISESDVKTTDPNSISQEIAILYPIYDRLLIQSKVIREADDYESLIGYIDECIELKCRLVEIHPFEDGNGRTFRALVNLLFRKIGLPPVYVKKSEKNEYIAAMDKAIRLKDTSTIKKFYYYKILDSIVELDLKERMKQEKLEQGKTLTKTMF